ncbi:ABC transporter ATP-binding protein [Bacteroides eggerthii]|uniref:ABC transporter ATP-binding protein n=1 Tax=Bacteroides eggerthii TaxID=28111 RepID=A0ABT7U739_9BACE|nr:ABC transporter ATP-binding protein [Bacteroides eggerthii]
MIRIEDISFAYRKGRKQVFRHFNAGLELGGIYGLLGKNGAGKSTLLHLMAGLVAPSEGKVLLHGEEMSKRSVTSLQSLFLVPEEFSLPAVSLDRYVRYMAPFYPRFSAEILKRALDCFELSGDLHLDRLSMGQRKKVFVSFALAANTEWLLLDEPTNGLDIPGKRQFRKILVQEMNEERGVVISTHQVQDVEHLLDRLLIVDQGQALLQKTVAEVCETVRFAQTSDPDLLRRAIYQLPSLQGASVLLPNEDGVESNLDLELLFNALMEKREEVTALFAGQKKDHVAR